MAKTVPAKKKVKIATSTASTEAPLVKGKEVERDIGRKAEPKGVSAASEEEQDVSEDGSIESGISEEDSAREGESGAESDDQAAIMQALENKQQKKKKRKRALPASKFGETLSGLLEEPPKASALKPAKPQNHPVLEQRARKIAHLSRHELLERGHAKDVISEWGPRPKERFSQWKKGEEEVDYENGETGGAEREKELRRLAQRGVVRLFNAIRGSQSAVDESNRVRKAEKTSEKGSKVSTAAPPAPTNEKTNLLSARGKEAALTNMSRDAFLDLIKGR